MSAHTYEITIDEEKRLVHLVVTGELDKFEGQQVIKETRAKAAETNYNILCDITGGTVKATMADWYYLARNKDIYPSRPSGKTAILINPDARKIYKFVQDVTRNAGLNIRIFLKKEDALDWLKKVD